MMLFGIIGANGSKILFGELLWDPLLIVDNWTSKVFLIPSDAASWLIPIFREVELLRFSAALLS